MMTGKTNQVACAGQQAAQSAEISRREFLCGSARTAGATLGAAAGLGILAGASVFPLGGCAADAGTGAQTSASDPSASSEAPVVLEPTAPDSDSTADPTPDPEANLVARAEQIVDALTLEQQVAQLFLVRPEALLNSDPTAYDEGLDGLLTVDDGFRAAYAGLPVGGFILFSRNLADAGQASALLADLTACSRDAYAAQGGLPVFLGVDEEGGTVSRIGGAEGFGVENVGDMADLGATGDTALAYQTGSHIADYLTELGFNLNFAPVCDIASNPEGTMGRRALGTTAEEVAPMVQALVEGMLGRPAEAEPAAEADPDPAADAAQTTTLRMLCCAKHFPGIGGAFGDSHDQSIYTDRTFDQMATEEFVPFAAAIQAGVPLVMVGHLTCLEATGSDAPASLSPQVMAQLRETLGFDGIICTDALEMNAVTDLYAPADTAVAAITAGSDIALMPTNLATAYQGVLDAVADGRLTADRVRQSAVRVVRAKLMLGGGAA